MLISSCSLSKLTSLISFSDDEGADSCADFLADPVRVSCKFWLFNFLFVFNDDEDLEAVIIYVDGNNIVDALVFFFLLFSSSSSSSTSLYSSSRAAEKKLQFNNLLLFFLFSF